jgi:hypothetical protein
MWRFLRVIFPVDDLGRGLSLERAINLRLFLLPVLAFLAAAPARADSPYEGKTITIVTSTGVGGVYDLTARVIARHMGRHIPGNPTLIVQNMPGGGNVLATNYMYNIAPKDGLSTTPCRCIRCWTAAACGSTRPSSTGWARPAPRTR